MSIYSRRSIRKYTDRPVSRELIEQLLGAAAAAPSAKNRQPWRFIVLGGEHKSEFLDRMESGICREEREPALPDSASGIPDAKHTLKVMREAPILVVVLNTNSVSPFVEISADDRITELCDTLSIGAAIENMLLKADELGLGTLWIANTCYAYSELTAYLGTDYQLVGAVSVGYGAEAPAQRPRKAIDEIAEFRL